MVLVGKLLAINQSFAIIGDNNIMAIPITKLITQYIISTEYTKSIIDCLLFGCEFKTLICLEIAVPRPMSNIANEAVSVVKKATSPKLSAPNSFT